MSSQEKSEQCEMDRVAIFGKVSEWASEIIGSEGDYADRMRPQKGLLDRR